jgi:hypothetical protein
MTDILRYPALAAPGLGDGRGGRGVARMGLGLPGWVAGGGLGGVLVVKDVLMFPAMRAVFRPPRRPQPVAAVGKCVETLAPAGYVRVNGGLWLAESRGPMVPAGRPVVARKSARSDAHRRGSRGRAERSRPGHPHLVRLHS